MLQALFCLSYQVHWPYGTYAAKVQPAFFPSQEIFITTLEPQKGTLRLKGVVNICDEFTYDYDKREWNVHLGPKTMRAMKRFHCSIEHIQFKQGAPIVVIRLPILGRLAINMKKT